jgi:AcrR family transcriptional regulator
VRPAPAPLSRERIVDSAIALADADGLDAVSLRKVAAVLDAGPMRLYGYLATKDELLELMVDAVYAEITPPEPGVDWREALRSLANQTRQVTRRHEWFADLVGGRPSLGPHALARLEATLAALAGGSDVDTLRQAADTFDAYLVGAIRKEVAERRGARVSGMDERHWQIAASPYLRRMLATGRYPTLARVVQEASHPDADTVFTVGLEWLLDGIAARLAR